MTEMPPYGHLTVLGHHTAQPVNPDSAVLERVINPAAGKHYVVRLTCPEFTSLCPLGGIESDADELALLKGGAPDFATISITYVPGKVCVELKSLKFYLWSFRNDGIFYERVVNRILDDLVKAVKPRRMSVVGDFNVRGGIYTSVVAERRQPGWQAAAALTLP